MSLAEFFYWSCFLALLVALGGLGGIMVGILAKGTPPYLLASNHKKIWRWLWQLLIAIGAMGCLLSVAGCAGSTPSAGQVVKPCALVWGTENDWNVISDVMAESIANANDLCKAQGNPI